MTAFLCFLFSVSPTGCKRGSSLHHYHGGRPGQQEKPLQPQLSKEFDSRRKGTPSFRHNSLSLLPQQQQQKKNHACYHQHFPLPQTLPLPSPLAEVTALSWRARCWTESTPQTECSAAALGYGPTTAHDTTVVPIWAAKGPSSPFPSVTSHMAALWSSVNKPSLYICPTPHLGRTCTFTHYTIPLIGELCLVYLFSISTVSTKALKSKIGNFCSPLEQTVMPSKLRGTPSSARGRTGVAANWSSRNCVKETRSQEEQGLVRLTANV